MKIYKTYKTKHIYGWIWTGTFVAVTVLFIVAAWTAQGS